MKRRERFAPPAVGGTSLLVIFAVLVFCVFALLSLTAAQAEERLAEASWNATQGWYQAEKQAHEIYARLRQGEIPAEVTREGDSHTYTCPVSQGQHLAVTLLCRDGQWECLSWQAVALPPEGDTQINVWDGNVP